MTRTCATRLWVIVSALLMLAALSLVVQSCAKGPPAPTRETPAAETGGGAEDPITRDDTNEGAGGEQPGANPSEEQDGEDAASPEDANG